MSCTDESPASATCTCASDSAPCEATSYCYEGACTSSSRCGAALCLDPCACVDSGHKIAQQCHGAAQFCKIGVVSQLCEPGVVNQTDCYCEIESALKCQQGNVCIDGQCYGRGDGVAGILCDPNYRCLDTCACVAPDNTAALCSFNFKKCADGKISDSECTANAKMQDSCRCNYSDAETCDPGRQCVSFNCETLGTTIPQCKYNEPCFLSCACVKDGKKIGTKCKGSQFECVSGLVKRMCEQNRVNQTACYCERESNSACGANNMCLGLQCFGASESELALSGGFCAENTPCEAECACVNASSRSGQKCAGKHHRCVSGEVILKCFDGYGHDLTGQECLPCERGCRLCAINKNYCTACLQGYKLRRGKCSEATVGNGVIAGSVLAAVAVVVLFGVCVYYLHRRRKAQRQGHSLPQLGKPRQNERGNSFVCVQ